MRFFLISLALISVATPATAQVADSPAPAQATTASPEAIELARRVLEQSGFDEQMRAGHDMMVPVMSMTLPGILSQQSDGSDILSVIERDFPGGLPAFSERYAAHYRDRLHHYLPDMMDATARIYAERMTREHLEATLAFLETDAGRAWSSMVNGYEQLTAAATAEYGMRAGNEALDLMTAELRAATAQPGEE